MSRQIIHSDAAPAAIGPYSQAVRVGSTVYLSGQTPLDPVTMKLVEGDVSVQAQQVFKNLAEVCKAGGGDFSKVVRVGIYMTDLGNFAKVNEVMKQHFAEPFPARSTIGVAALPLGAQVEIDLVMVLD